MLKGPLVVGAVVGATVAALFGMQMVLTAVQPDPVERAAPEPVSGAALPSADPIPVGRDPFATPFGADGAGEKHGGILVKPPGVVRHGDVVAAATTVVNENHDRWLPASTVTFVARGATGDVVATATADVSLGPGDSQTVIAPDLGVDASAIAAIEAHIDAAPMRTKGYRPPDVSVGSATVGDAGKAISGSLDVAPNADGSVLLACVAFDSLDELAGVGSTTVDLSKAQNGRLEFWISTQAEEDGPLRASCAVS